MPTQPQTRFKLSDVRPVPVKNKPGEDTIEIRRELNYAITFTASKYSLEQHPELQDRINQAFKAEIAEHFYGDIREKISAYRELAFEIVKQSRMMGFEEARKLIDGLEKLAAYQPPA